MPVNANGYIEPGSFAEYKPTSQFVTLPGGARIVALIGKSKSTLNVLSEEVVKGAAEGSDELEYTATAVTEVKDNIQIYIKDTDYQLTDGKIDWSLATAAEMVGTEGVTTTTGKFDFGDDDLELVLTIDNGSDLTVTLTGEMSASEVVDAINAVLLTSATASVYTTSDSKDYIKIVTVATKNGIIEMGNGSANAKLGFSSGVKIEGSKEPDEGDTYYVTYTRNKVTADYVPMYYFNTEDIFEEHGEPNTTNTVSLGAEIAFKQNASVVLIVPIRPDITPESQAFAYAIDQIKSKACNYVVALTENATVRSYLKAHVVAMSNYLERKWRMAIFGLDSDPSNTTLASITSVATGLGSTRCILVYPTQVEYPIQNVGDTTIAGYYLAAAVAGMAANSNYDVSEPLLRKEPTGFTEIPDVVGRTEKNILASAGVCIIDAPNGTSRIRHPLTTAQTGKPEDQEINIVEVIDYVAESSTLVTEAMFVGTKILLSTPALIKTAVSAYLGTLKKSTMIADFSDITAVQDGTEPRQINVTFKFKPSWPCNWIYVVFTLMS